MTLVQETAVTRRSLPVGATITPSPFFWKNLFRRCRDRDGRGDWRDVCLPFHGFRAFAARPAGGGCVAAPGRIAALACTHSTPPDRCRPS